MVTVVSREVSGTDVAISRYIFLGARKYQSAITSNAKSKSVYRMGQ